MTKASYYAILLCLLTALFTPGCTEKRGCTDPYSDNYDPDATQDDDTCVPTRSKFVGKYEANGTISGLAGPGLLTPFDDVFIEVEDSTVLDPLGIVISIIGMDPEYQILPLDALVSGTYRFDIPNQSIAEITYYGDGNINGRVIEMDVTRLEKITNPDETFYFDTLYLYVYGIKLDE